MKIPLVQPQAFSGVLDPADLNAHFQYMQNAVADVASRRWQHSFLPLQFVEAVGTPYTNATNSEVLTYRLTCPTDTVVDGAFLSANMTSAAEVTVTIVSSGGVTPTGATTPWLSSNGAVADITVDTSDANPDRVLLLAGVEYLVAVTSTGIFTLGRFDVVLHLVVDRFGTSGVPATSPELLSTGDEPDAAIVNANNGEVTSAAALFAANVAAAVPMIFCVHGIVTATSANVRTFTIPRSVSTRSQGRIVRMYLYGVSATTLGTTHRAELLDETGATQHTLTISVAGVLRASGDSGAVAFSLTNASTTTTSDTTKDWTLVLSNQSAVVASKLYCVLWLSR